MSVYYDNTLIEPAPKISISYQPIYANDSIIGYNNIITLNGIASTLEVTKNTPGYNFLGNVVKKIDDVQNLLIKNGKTLSVTHSGTTVLTATGGILRSLNFDQSPNNWSAYAPYTAEIEFNELQLINDNFNCSNSFVHNNSIINQLVDIEKYKIKNFSDSWSFEISDNVYDYYANSIVIDNSVIRATYNISATGKQYINSSGTLPAWAQAKIFAQDRLYKQVSAMNSSLTNILTLESNDGESQCNGSTAELAELNRINTNVGMMDSTMEQDYNIYNEIISCSISESDSTCNITYNCILKRGQPVLHTASVDKSYTGQGSKDSYSISAKGSIQGLCIGGLVSSGGNFSLQNNGSLLFTAYNTNSRYQNAKNFADTIISSVGIGADLSDSYKTFFGITAENLGLDQANQTCAILVHPASINLTKNYTEGIIEYSAEYNTANACIPRTSYNITSVNWSYDLSTALIAEHPLPQGNHFVQHLGTSSAKKVSIVIEGNAPRICLDGSTVWPLNSIDSMANIPGINESDFILTTKETVYNPLEGTYRTTLGYTCNKGQFI